MVVTEDLIELARKKNPCKSGIGAVRPGMSVHEVNCEHLEWFEQRFPFTAAKIVQILITKECYSMIIRGSPNLALFGCGAGGWGNACWGWRVERSGLPIIWPQ